MGSLKNEFLLSDNRVQEEISKHRWIESEKAGADIGFDNASKDWLTRYSEGWMKANLSRQATSACGAPKGNGKTRARRIKS